ncbi:hypothetical protein [Legionella cincinnatiensis]|uniref:Uncharacterized protein n=1 Tax=Legionella cincinnatiensis TaxID=28085 RepID=A0A378IGX0_9GAMM|nr:hypothetical protein [Legionella cincinnatiensis]KTC84316.1 hypothetical protein Lcin_1879 [Legionella cincinnatiensis]STX33992.1 Uncharacterised protein [Legionella cincinnatiensis]
MKDSIISLYKLGLEKHHLVNNRGIILYLIEEISKARTIEDLIKLFSNYLNSDGAHYETISLNSQLSDWKKDLEDLKSAQQQILVELGKIPTTSKNKNLLLLLKEVLSDSHLLLHSYITHLLNIFYNNSISDLIDYIIQIPIAPKPLNPPPGSFAAQTPRSEQHAECLILLNNLASVKEKERLWETANSLLQTSLTMYQELEFLEVSLDDEKDLQKIEHKCCSIM